MRVLECSCPPPADAIPRRVLRLLRHHDPELLRDGHAVRRVPAARRRVAALLLCFLWTAWSVQAGEPAVPPDFSGTVVKRVNGRQYQAQVFAKGDRLRLEYKYAIRTEYGLSAIEIIRMDQGEAWYLLAQQKELLVSSLNPDDVLPLQPHLHGERTRVLVGDATAAGRPAKLYEVQTDRDGRAERFYEWVDDETGIVLKLVSRDRDWSFEYERLRLSAQPAYYFDQPPGYTKRTVPAVGKGKG